MHCLFPVIVRNGAILSGQVEALLHHPADHYQPSGRWMRHGDGLVLVLWHLDVPPLRGHATTPNAQNLLDHLLLHRLCALRVGNSCKGVQHRGSSLLSDHPRALHHMWSDVGGVYVASHFIGYPSSCTCRSEPKSASTFARPFSSSI